MRYKEIDIENLTEAENEMRKCLQYEYDNMKKMNCEGANFEWSGIFRFADCLVAPRKWAVKNAGIVILVEVE